MSEKTFKREKELHLRELWDSFEKTGSIGAYMIYNELRKKKAKGRQQEIKK